MKNLAPNILRQRLLLEGFYKIDVSRSAIQNYFKKISKSLNLKIYGEPIIFSPAGKGKKINQGYDAFAPLVDSGISLYAWSNVKFLSIIIYTCKSFDENRAIATTKKLWKINKIESQTF